MLHPTSFLDITNPAYHNFNQPSVSDWSYLNQYNPCPQSYDHNSRIISTLHRVDGDSPPPSPIFNQLVLLIHLVHNIFKIHTQFHRFKIKNYQSWKWVCVSPSNNHKIWRLTISSQIPKQNFIFSSPITTKWWINQLWKDAWSHDSCSNRS